MKRLFAFASVMLLPLLVAAQTANQHQRFTLEGAFATFSEFTPPFTAVSLRVSTTMSTGTPATASLQYSLVSETSDFSSLTITNVFGPIPASAFTGQNTQQLSLNIDTTTLDPTIFFSETCTIVFATATETCAAGPAGVIQLNFQENDFQSTQINLHQVDDNGPVTTRIYQRSDNSTANVQGSVFGSDVSGSPASVGVNHNSTLEIIHN